MKFTEGFVSILKNFAGLTSGMKFIQGSRQSIMTNSGTIVAVADTDTVCDSDFLIADLPKFISIITFFDKPDIIVDPSKSFVTIVSGDKSVRFATGADKNEAGKKIFEYVDDIEKYERTFVNPKVEFKLPFQDFSSIMKVGGVIDAKFFSFSGDGEKINMHVFSNENQKGNSNDVNFLVGETDQTFKSVLIFENMKFLKRDYNVKIAFKQGILFEAEDVKYFCAIQTKQSH